MKICEGTKKIKGCGFPKDESEFYSTYKWKTNVCKECVKIHKRKKYTQDKQINNIAVNMAWR